MSAHDWSAAIYPPPRETPRGRRGHNAAWLLLVYGAVTLFGGHWFAPLVLVLGIAVPEFPAMCIAGWAGLALLAAWVSVRRPGISSALLPAAIACLSLSIVLCARVSELPALTLVSAVPFLVLSGVYLVRRVHRPQYDRAAR